MKPVHFDFRLASASDLGRRRRRNEDMVLSMPEHGVFLVADGMGGGAAGDVASRAVCFYIRDAITSRSPNGPLPLADTVRVARDACDRASKWIHNIAPQLGARMVGTTILALIFDPERHGRAVALHAGDTRIYRYRGKILEPLSIDHSAANSLGIEDLDQLPAEYRGMITRAVGVRDSVELEETELVVLPKDIFLLCSDGFYNMVQAPEAAPLFRSFGDDLPKLAENMIHHANEAGGMDNISVILVERLIPQSASEYARKTIGG